MLFVIWMNIFRTFVGVGVFLIMAYILLSAIRGSLLFKKLSKSKIMLNTNKEKKSKNECYRELHNRKTEIKLKI